MKCAICHQVMSSFELLLQYELENGCLKCGVYTKEKMEVADKKISCHSEEPEALSGVDSFNCRASNSGSSSYRLDLK